MINNIINYLKDKNLAVLGYGLEGKSTVSFLLKYLPDKKITIIDKNVNVEKIDNPNVEYLLGEDYLDYLNNFDLIIKTPGISLVDKEVKATVKSQFSLFLEFSNCKVIGVTGTKGKSTTTSLIYEIIKNQYENTFLVGNIGIPIFDLIEEFNDKSIVVAEISAHQLYDVTKSPNISIITNLFEEHLDYFHSLNNYYNSKLNIAKYQKEDDYLIYLKDNDELDHRVNQLNLKSHIIPLGNDNIINEKIVIDNKEVFDLTKDKQLVGYYNNLNIMMALEVAIILSLDLARASETICNFEGLDHRMKLVATKNGISFYDDTLATIPAASINSVYSLPNVKTLILGGMDRNIDYSEYIEELKKSTLNNIICQPDTGKMIYDSLVNKCDKNIYYIDDLESAVKKAYELTEVGESILLSPAAPSYNVYKNYADKSKNYIDIINKL